MSTRQCASGSAAGTAGRGLGGAGARTALFAGCLRGSVLVLGGAGLAHVAAATGRTSEEAARRRYGLSDSALIEMGDFAGGVLKYLRRHPVPRLTLAGGFAKISKLAQGALDLHSARSTIEIGRLADFLGGLGLPAEAIALARESRTALGVLEAAGARAPALADLIAAQAREVALATLSGGTAVDVLVTDRKGEIIGHAGP